MLVRLVEFENAETCEVSAGLGEAGFRVAPGSAEPLRAHELAEIFLISGSVERPNRAADLCLTLRRSGYRGALIVIGPRLPGTIGVAALEAGADDFVGRPFEMRELVARLRAVLRRVGDDSTIQWSVLTADRRERVVYLRGRPMRLTAREFALLVSLMEAQGKLVSRAELLANIDGRDGAARSNLVNVHLSRVRDKLGADARLIETVRRGGYKLRP